MKLKISYLVCIGVFMLSGCQSLETQDHRFGDDLCLLEQVVKPIVLTSGASQVVLAAEFQGRVLTSTSQGEQGRLWFGPEAGAYSIFFEPGAEQIPENVHVADALTNRPFSLVKQTDMNATFAGTLRIRNYQDVWFTVDVPRDISIHSRTEIEDALGITLIAEIATVGFSVQSSMKHVGDCDWAWDTGVLSLWELGCFPPSPKTTVVIPLRNENPEAQVYFTAVGDDRLRIVDGTLFYRADADYTRMV